MPANDGASILYGTQQGIDEVFSPQERAARLTRDRVEQNAAQLRLDEAFATSESKVGATNAQNDNLAAAADQAFNDRIDEAALAELTKPFTDQTTIDEAITAAQAAGTTRAQYDLGAYESARQLDGSAGLTRREILGVAAQDPTLSFATRAEAKRILRGQDIVDTQQLSVTTPEDALNEASRMGLIPQKIQAARAGEDDYTVTVGSSAPQRLDRRGIQAMFNDLMRGNSAEGDKYRAEQDKADAALGVAQTRVEGALGVAKIREGTAAANRTAADGRAKLRAQTQLALPGARVRAKEAGTYLQMADGTPITMKDAVEYLQQPEIREYLQNPAAPTKLTPNTVATAKRLVEQLRQQNAPKVAAKAAFDPAVGVRGQRLVDPITGK